MTTNNRANALAIACPTCHAQPGQPCTGRRGIRTALHRERYDNVYNPVRETRSYDLGPLGNPGCPHCEGTGFMLVERVPVDRYGPCHCRKDSHLAET